MKDLGWKGDDGGREEGKESRWRQAWFLSSLVSTAVDTLGLRSKCISGGARNVLVLFLHFLVEKSDPW